MAKIKSKEKKHKGMLLKVVLCLTVPLTIAILIRATQSSGEEVAKDQQSSSIENSDLSTRGLFKNFTIDVTKYELLSEEQKKKVKDKTSEKALAKTEE